MKYAKHRGQSGITNLPLYFKKQPMSLKCVACTALRVQTSTYDFWPDSQLQPSTFKQQTSMTAVKHYEK